MSDKPAILHLITSAKNLSPFDVNMAIDAGFAHIIPYTQVAENEIAALTQDAMFSRSPSGVKRQAIFFGGRDLHLALRMQNAAKQAMFAPFQVSTMADPSGAFTTAAAIIAKLEKALQAQAKSLKNSQLIIFGASGSVGTTAALLAVHLGAQVTLAAHREVESMQNYANNLKADYGVQLQVAAAHDAASKQVALTNQQLVVCAAAAGVRVLDEAMLENAPNLLALADVNAVPPSGIAGVDAMDDGKLLANGAKAFGALAIGQLKYQIQHSLLKNLLQNSPQHSAHLEALALGLTLA